MTTTLPSRDPATGEVVGEVPITPTGAIPEVVARARAAQSAWAELGVAGRIERLRAIGARLEARADELGALVSREMGKPLAEARGEVRACAAVESELAEFERAFTPEELTDGRARSTVYRDPFGVCAAIAPWNFPIAMPHSLVFPALAAGNAVVLKPSEETPLCGQAYAELAAAELPADVLQVVHGADGQGAALVAADIDLVAFTGSRETGKAILSAAAPRLVRVLLELGGKDPLLVLDGADVAAAARFAARNSYRNAGQVCVSTERIYVAAPVAERFVDLLAEETAKLRVGPGSDPDTDVGPMISERQRDHVLRQIEDAVARGARVVAGGTGHRDRFVAPTLLTGVTAEMDIARDETFGPVACVTVVANEDEAVRSANDSPFGLGAVVFGPEERARGVARRLSAGMIGINKSVGGARGAPWVGARESGYGFHSSVDGHRQFAQTRVVSEPA